MQEDGVHGESVVPSVQELLQEVIKLLVIFLNMFIDFPVVSPSSQRNFRGRRTVKEPEQSNQHGIIEKELFALILFVFITNLLDLPNINKNIVN